MSSCFKSQLEKTTKNNSWEKNSITLEIVKVTQNQLKLPILAETKASKIRIQHLQLNWCANFQVNLTILDFGTNFARILILMFFK